MILRDGKLEDRWNASFEAVRVLEAREQPAGWIRERRHRQRLKDERRREAARRYYLLCRMLLRRAIEPDDEVLEQLVDARTAAGPVLKRPGFWPVAPRAFAAYAWSRLPALSRQSTQQAVAAEAQSLTAVLFAMTGRTDFNRELVDVGTELGVTLIRAGVYVPVETPPNLYLEAGEWLFALALGSLERPRPQQITRTVKLGGAIGSVLTVEWETAVTTDIEGPWSPADHGELYLTNRRIFFRSELTAEVIPHKTVFHAGATRDYFVVFHSGASRPVRFHAPGWARLAEACLKAASQSNPMKNS